MGTIFTAMRQQQVRQGDVLITPVLMPVAENDVGNLIEEFDTKTFQAAAEGVNAEK